MVTFSLGVAIFITERISSSVGALSFATVLAGGATALIRFQLTCTSSYSRNDLNTASATVMDEAFSFLRGTFPSPWRRWTIALMT